MASTFTYDEFCAIQRRRDDALRTELSKFDTQFVNVNNEIRERFANVDNEIRYIHNEFSNVRAEFANVHTELDGVRAEFGNVHAEFGNVHAEMANFRGELRTMNARSDELLEQVTRKINKLACVVERNDAVLYNSRAKPYMQPKPPPIYDADEGLMYPPEVPKSVKAFHKLSNPQTSGQKDLLYKLVQFYGVEDHSRWQIGSDTESDDDFDPDQLDDSISLKEATERYPSRAVEKLASLWGLDKAIYDEFEARRATSASKAGKRSRESESPRDAKRREHGQQKLASEPGLAMRLRETPSNPSHISDSNPSRISDSNPLVSQSSHPSQVQTDLGASQHEDEGSRS